MARLSRFDWNHRARGAAPRHGIYHASLNVPGLPPLKKKPLSKAARLRCAVTLSAKAREAGAKAVFIDALQLEEIRRLGT